MRLAFLDLPDDRVDLISLARASSRVRIVFVAHTQPDALALQMAADLAIPRSTEPLDLLALKPDRVALPSHETPSAAALARAGISPRIFTTLDELAVSLTSGREFSGGNGDPEPIESWELLPEPEPGPSPPRNDANTPFHAIEESLARSADHAGILAEILARAMERVGADGGSLMLLDRERNELRIAAAEGLSDACVRSTRRKVGDGIAGSVAQTGEPRILHDHALESGTKRRERARMRASISAPLLANGRVLGVLNVSSDRPERRFEVSDQRALTEIAALASGILERITRDEDRDGDAEEFRSRRAIDGAASASAGPDQRWRDAALGIRSILDADRAVLYRTDAAGERFTVFAADSDAKAETTVPVRLAGLASRVVQTGEPILVETPLDLGGAGRAPEPLTLALVPITDGGRVRGVLELEWERFPKSRDLIETIRLATRIGSAIGSRPEGTGAAGDGRRADLLARLADLAPRFIVPHDLGSLLAESIAALRDLFGPQFFAVRLKDARGEAHFRSAFDGPEDVRLGLGAIEREAGERTMEDGVERASVSENEDSPPREAAPVHGLVPIRLGERIVGTLGVVLQSPGERARAAHAPRLGRNELEAMRTLSLYIALAASRAFAEGATETHAPKDALTGLLGCTGLEARVLDEIKRVERYHDRFLLTFCSIPGLARLKDQHGAGWVETLVREFALALAKNVREVDAVARIGGGRFAVLSPETDKNGGALLQRLDQILPGLESVRTLPDPDAIHLVGRQYSYPDEIPTGGEVLALIRSSYAPE
jgi:diguanylate cyclase (GGDEF)-like protein